MDVLDDGDVGARPRGQDRQHAVERMNRASCTYRHAHGYNSPNSPEMTKSTKDSPKIEERVIVTWIRQTILDDHCFSHVTLQSPTIHQNTSRNRLFAFEKSRYTNSYRVSRQNTEIKTPCSQTCTSSTIKSLDMLNRHICLLHRRSRPAPGKLFIDLKEPIIGIGPCQATLTASALISRCPIQSALRI
jgi:hypothetical protein